MGKKRSRSTYTSKGIHSNVSKSTLKLVRNSRTELEKELNKAKAWRKNLNPWITVKNTQSGTNRPYYKVRANDVMGDPRKAGANIYGARKEGNNE